MRLLPLAALCAAPLLAGCSGLPEKIGSMFEKTDREAAALVKDVGRVVQVSSGKPANTSIHEDGHWIGKSIVKAEGPVLPPIFKEPATFDRTVSSLAEFAERITLRSGIPAKVSPDALVAANAAIYGNAGAAAGTPLPTSPVAPPAPGLPAIGSAIGHAGGAAARQNTQFRITYSSGSFKGLLDTASARMGVHWRYVDGVIQFYFTDSRTFQVNAIPGDSSFTATVSSGATSAPAAGGGGAGGAGGAGAGGVTANNTQNTAVTSQLAVYASIEKAITAMLSPNGKVVASPATGTITVVDTPDRLDRIADFIDAENKALSRQVVINVTVLAVTVSDADEYGINWDLVYNNLRERYGVKNTVASSPNSVGFSAGILSTATSRFAGTSLVIKALSEQGKVRRHTTASVVTLNNQPVPVQVAKQTSYLRSSQTTTTALVGSTTTLTPGTVTSGFNMSILPHVLANGTVMLQFSTDISSLRGIRTVASSGAAIETPEMDTRNFLQRVAMKSNETLVISGFEQTDDNLDEQGVGSVKNFLFGGGFKAKSSREVIVILITPTTMSAS